MSDVDNDNTMTINIAAKLRDRFSYFSLTNIGNQNEASELLDQDAFYTEQNIRWQVTDTSPLDLTIQLNFRSGEYNDRHRLGVRWRLHNTIALRDFFQAIHLIYAINLHAIQFDHEDADVWQIEHAFKLTFPYISDRLYLGGFIDHTFNEDLASEVPSNPIVSEIQLGYRLIENVYAVSEFRINEYRRSDVNNMAVGIEYTIKW